MVWGTVAVLLAALTGAHMLTSGHGAGLVAATLGVTAFAAMSAFALCEQDDQRWRWTRFAAGRAFVGTVIWGSLIGTWSGLGLVLAVLLTGTSPALLGLAGTGLRSRRRTRLAGPPEGLARSDLLRRWRWTTTEIRNPSTPTARRMVLVEERRRLLDELEQRDPAAFAAWIPTAVPAGRPRGPDDRELPR